MHPSTRLIALALWTAVGMLSPLPALAMNAVYLESNAEGSNEIALLIQVKDGGPLELIDTYPTGGQGEPAIDGNQAHALATNGKFLFVTNTGDDSISIFRIGTSGRLTLIGKSPALGHRPVSLTVIQNNLIVLNQGDTDSKNPIVANVQRFRILQDGQLLALQGSYSYLPSSVPVDVIAPTWGQTFTVTLSGISQLDSFQLESNGSISRTGSTSGISNPLGSAMGRLNPHKLAVTLADDSLPGVASLYINRNGLPERVFQNIRASLMDPCWAVSNAASTWLWTSAFLTRTLSLYRWEANGDLRFISDLTPEMTGPGGLDLAMSQNDKTLFWLRVGDVVVDQRPIRPFIESFNVNVSAYQATAGVALISRTLLPESWSSASPGGILSLPIKP